MTCKAGGTVIGISLDTAMLIIHISLVVCMAVDAGELCIACRVFVAIAAVAPFSVVLA